VKVYHWSPTVNRERILREGLLIMNSQIDYENPITGTPESWKPPYICTSPDPWTAYTYVIPMFGEGNVPPLDLFCIELAEGDDVIFRNDRTIHIIEVRVCNSVPPDRVHYLATREKDY
jgi:hypothetical protein